MAKTSGTPRVYYPDRAYNCEIPDHLAGKKVHATWVTYKERSIWCCDFSAYEDNRKGLLTEIELSDTVIRQQAPNSLLVAVVLYKTRSLQEIFMYTRR